MFARIRSTCDGDLEKPANDDSAPHDWRALCMQLTGDGEPCKQLTADKQTSLAALHAANQQHVCAQACVEQPCQQ